MYLCLVPDEVDFWLGRLRGRGRGNCNLRLFLRLLHEHVDEGLLLGRGGDGRQFRHCGRRRRGRLDEHDLVVLLRGRRRRQRLLGGVVRGLRGRHVHVYVFVDDRSLGRRAVRVRQVTREGDNSRHQREQHLKQKRRCQRCTMVQAVFPLNVF